MKSLSLILNLFFPSKCIVCGKLGNYFCSNCYQKIKKYEIKNQYQNTYFVYKYQDLIRDLIIKYKFEDKPYIYRAFSESLIKNKKLCKFLKSYDIIIPVPLHKKRLYERGYNQSDLIAHKLAQNLNMKYLQNVLIRKVGGAKQSTKKLQDRIKDVIGIYEVKNSELIKNKNIVIFDDIYTTGSTLKECKKVLINSGAKNVGIVALAKDYID